MEEDIFNKKCVNHENENFTCYCFDDKVFLCDKCFKEHRKHNIDLKANLIKNNELYNSLNVENNINETLEEVKSKINDIRKEIDDIIKSIDELLPPKEASKETTENKDGENKDGENKDGENKDNENKETENKDNENKETENKETEKTENENKVNDKKDNEKKDSDNKDNENKDNEKKDIEKKDDEKKDSDNKDNENKNSENKDNENKDGENKDNANKETEKTENENKVNENKDNENKDNENKDNENKDTEKEKENKDDENKKKGILSLTFEQYENIEKYKKLFDSVDGIGTKFSSVKEVFKPKPKKENSNFRNINKEVKILEHSHVYLNFSLDIMLNKKEGKYSCFNTSANHYAVFDLGKKFFLNCVLISVKQAYGCVVKDFKVSIKNNEENWELVNTFRCKDNKCEVDMQKFPIQKETRFVRIDFLNAWSTQGGNLILIRRLAFNVADIVFK